ncbi:MFS transporter [Nocardia sp. NPDC050717]|uniref:MFS transporter n=1 Tax=Nocardia sp. NPDC050717 TaxID=3157221 RepID=UPI00341000EA
MSRLTGEPVGVRGLAVRAVLFKGTRDLLPIYALYGVLFADHGLNTAQISLLLALWSVTAFVLEVPSGAWADTVSRRALLILSCLLQVACFVVWMLAPSFAGFGIGFVLWGIAGALASGTFEALIYDDLVARGEPSAYARIMGWTRAAQESTVLFAILAGAPLFALGGYALVGWVSVGVGVLHILTAVALPSPPVAISASAVDELDDEPPIPGPQTVPGTPPARPGLAPADSGVASVDTGASPADTSAIRVDPQHGAEARGDRRASTGRGDPTATQCPAGGPSVAAAEPPPTGRSGDTEPQSAVGDGGASLYLAMLRTGTAEAWRVRRVRRGVLLGALLSGVTAFDEYFGLLAVTGGASTAVSALLLGVAVVGSLVGSVLAGRTEAAPARALAAALFVAGILFIGGALAVGTASPVLLWVGFVGIGIAYGIDYNVEVVAGARLQDAIEGPARATVTSFSGLLSEVVALAVFGFVAAATQWLSMSTTIALLGAVLLVAAVLTPSWLPPRSDADSAG